MPLTPNNREESWLKGMVDGSTTLTPNKRREYWYQEIINAQGGGGGGGGGATVLTATVDENYDATLPCTAAELYALTESGIVIVKYSYTFDGLLANNVASIVASFYTPNGSEHGVSTYQFQSNAFEIVCASGSDIPSWNVG